MTCGMVCVKAGELFVLGNMFAKAGALVATGAAPWALRVLGWPAVLVGTAAGYAVAGLLLLPRMAARADAEKAATL
jgi:hypothetical protein